MSMTRKLHGALLPLCGATVLAFPSTQVFAQQSTSTANPPPFKFIRSEEDYRYLADPSKRADPWDPIKYIPLGTDGGFLSFGGEVRERMESYSNPNFGLGDQSANAYLLQRVLLHADLHINEYIRSFVQVGSHLSPWKDNPAPPYLDKVDLQQAFIDLRLPLSFGGNADPTLRVGRQELAFGSQRLIAIRDAPSVRRNFDGVRITERIGGMQIDAFMTQPVLQKSGIFDDPWNQAQAFWGVYTTTPAIPVLGKFDFYYLGFENENARYAQGIGRENRQSIGSRWFGTRAGWDWDWEAVGQFGTFANGDIRAWTVTTSTGYTFSLYDWGIRLGLKADIASGDKNLNDRTLGTFNALFPKLGYLTSAALFAPSNVMDVQPSITLKPVDNLTLTMGYGLGWRTTSQDAAYIGAGIPVAGTAGNPDRFMGQQATFDLAWQVDRHVLVEAGYVHTWTAGALRAAGARDVDFTYLAATYRF